MEWRYLRLVLFTGGLSVSQALLVRSEGSGGLATGLAYNEKDDQAVIVGTTYDKEFWNIARGQGECFVAVGGASQDSQKFARLALTGLPAACFGGTSTLNHEEEGGLGVATIMGMNLMVNQNGETKATGVGFLHSVLYYLGQVTTGAAQPFDLPENLLPVATTRGIGKTAEAYIGLHVVEDSPFDGVTSSQLTPLGALLEYWWGSTFPSNVELLTGTSMPSTPLARPAPHVRKQDIFTGKLEYDVSLEGTTGSTALISDLALPSIVNDEASKRKPLIVVGSTNGADTSNSLFGQTLKAADLFDWDGYILFLDPDSGAVFEEDVETLEERDDGVQKVTIKKARPAMRINSVGDGDDFVQAACLSPDHRHLYVVGTTEGIISGIHKGGAFVFKLDLETNVENESDTDTLLYEVQWKYQLYGVNVQGLNCAADADAVYLGGSTESVLWDNSNNEAPTKSPDAFVTRIQNGQAQWIEPLDTTLQENGDDQRREVIVGMEVSNRGKVLVLMNSMNLKTGENDVFLLDLDPDTGDNELEQSLGELDITIPSFASGSSEDPLANEKDKTVIVVATIVPVVAALIIFGLTSWRYRTDLERLPKSAQKQELEREKKQAQDIQGDDHDDGIREVV